MKTFNNAVLFLIMVICLTFCASKEALQTHFPQQIKTAYFQKGIAEKKDSGQGIHFYIEFKKPLSKELKLQKIYFRNQVTKIVKINPRLYKAIFFPIPISKDLILDSDAHKEYGNEAPVIAKSKFDLKPDEAMLEYTSNDTLNYFKLTRVKEREMISHP